MIRFWQKILRHRQQPYNPTTIGHVEAWQWYRERHQQFAEAVNAIVPCLDRKAVLYDVGANIGYFSFLLMERLQFLGKAYLFEPVPNLARLCEETFRNMRFDVHIHQIALGDEDSDLEMLVDMDGNIGWNTLISEQKTANMRPITVQSRRLDSLDNLERPDFIKIDVEGSEYKVIRGMLSKLKTWRPLPVILCEVGWGRSHPRWEEELATFDDLASLGYLSYDIHRQPLDLAQLSQTCDVLFFPPNV